MKILLLTLLVTAHVSLFSQANYQHWQWVKSFGGSGKDSTVDIKIKNGYLYITGTFSSPTINWETTTLTNNGGTDIFIAKLDTNGNTIWVKNFGGASDDSVTQLEINDSGTTALLCNSKSSSINVGATSLTNPSNFYIELDKDGNVLNTNKLPDSLVYNDIDVDYQGGIYLASRYNTVFTFANTIVDTITPPRPFIWFGDYSFSPFGCALLKYDMNGNESWMKTFRSNAFDPSIYSTDPTTLSIEYNNFDTTVEALFVHPGNTLFGDSSFLNSDMLNEGASVIFLANISANSTIKVMGNFLSNSYHPIKLVSFQTSHLGLSFISTFGLRSLLDYDYQSLDVYDTANNNTHEINWLSANLSGNSGPNIYGNSDPNNIYNLSSVAPNEKGNLIMINRYDSSIDILDSNLIEDKNFSIPEANRINLLNKCLADSNAVYFGSQFTGDSLLILNNGIPSTAVFNLQNKGNANIFIGKYSISGLQLLSLGSFQDTFKVCNGMGTISLDSSIILNSYGAGGLHYQWSPAANFSSPDSLASNVITNSDTLISTLTITDANGNFVTKQIVFYNGVKSDLHLKVSDTSTCLGNTIKVSLQGTLFNNCQAIYSCNGYYQSVYFNSLNDTEGLYMMCQGVEAIKLIPLASSTYCFDTAATNVFVRPVYSTYQNITLCAGSSYTFPDNSIANNIQASTNHTSPYTAINGCDSSISTFITVEPAYPPQTKTITLCAGSNYVFPDSTFINNIQSDTSQTSYFKSLGGCDSIINTNIIVTPVYNQAQTITLCKGSAYMFPDNVSIIGIESDTDYTSHLHTINGCDSIITTHISIISVYDTTIYDTVCAGSSYTFPDGYQLNDIQTSTQHMSARSCFSFATTNLYVINIDTSITKTNAVLIANLNNAGYQWLDCSTNMPLINDTSQSYSAAVIGDYAMKVSQGGCIDTSSCYPVTSADLLGQRPAINVYPVPANGTLTITIQSNARTGLNVSLYNSTGENILTDVVTLIPGNNTITFNVQTLQEGVYTLKLVKTNTGETTIKKITIE